SESDGEVSKKWVAIMGGPSGSDSKGRGGLPTPPPGGRKPLAEVENRVGLRRRCLYIIPLPFPLPLRGGIQGDSATFSPNRQDSQFGENGAKSPRVNWWAEQVSNLRPRPCKGRALPN